MLGKTVEIRADRIEFVLPIRFKFAHQNDF